MAQNIQQIKPTLTTFVDIADSIGKYHADPSAYKGKSTGSPKLDELITLKEGNLHIITGIPSSGKSELMDQIMLNTIALHDWHWSCFSPENWPLEAHFQKMCEKWTGKPWSQQGHVQGVAPAEVQQTMQELSKSICFLDKPKGMMDLDTLLEACEMSDKAHTTNALLLDPWNEIEAQAGRNVSETNLIGESLSKLRNFGRKNKIAVFVVAHPTKLQKLDNGNYPVPTPYDISGCHAEGTEVLTNEGWKAHSMVTLKDKVACFDLETGLMQYQNPSKTWKFRVEGEMINFKAGSYDALVTPNHRMVVKPSWGKRHKIKGTGRGRPVAYDRDRWNFIEAHEFNGDMVIPWASEWVDAPDKETIWGYPADGLLQFLGWWVSEGWVNKASKGLGLCQGVGTLADKMKRVMSDTGINYTERIDPPGTGGTVDGWKAYIGVQNNRKLCEFVPFNCGVGCRNKKLPIWVWDLSNRQKAVLLDALIEGDGCQREEDTYSYATTSRKLCDDIQRLAIECGRMACFSWQKSKNPRHGDKCNINIGRKDRKEISCRKGRNVRTESHYRGMVYCLTVPTGAYLVRRNGKPFISGNSANWRNKADVCMAVWRDYGLNDGVVQVHVQKVRNKMLGKLGMAELHWNWSTGFFAEEKIDVNQASAYAIVRRMK